MSGLCECGEVFEVLDLEEHCSLGCAIEAGVDEVFARDVHDGWE